MRFTYGAIVCFLLNLLPVVTAQTPTPTTVGVVYRTYEFFHDSTGVGSPTSLNVQSQTVVNEAFARVNRTIPRVVGQNETIPTRNSGERVFEFVYVEASQSFAIGELYEATVVAGDTIPPQYLIFERFNDVRWAPPFIPNVTRNDVMGQMATGILAQLGWTVPTEPPGLPPDSFYVYGPNPNRTGTLRANVPRGWTVEWYDAIGRRVSSSATYTDAVSGTYFAIGTNLRSRGRETRRALVVR